VRFNSFDSTPTYESLDGTNLSSFIFLETKSTISVLGYVPGLGELLSHLSTISELESLQYIS
jgi:hypothetical protein